jgi:RAMA domain-containing protein
LRVGQILYSKSREYQATIKADSTLVSRDSSGSIHRVAADLQGQSAYNGWDFWHYEDETGNLISIDELRNHYRTENNME